MKKSILVFLIISILSVSLTGCSSTMKCTVYGTPGTKLYTSRGGYLGTVPQSGMCDIELQRKDYKHDFLLTQFDTESPIIPMGLDYSKRNNKARDTVTGITVFAFLPFFWIPTICWSNYNDRLDVEDCLKLQQHQSSNADLYAMVANASNPIDEMKTYSIKEHKSARALSPTIKKAKTNLKTDTNSSSVDIVGHKDAKSSTPTNSTPQSRAKGTTVSTLLSSDEFYEYTKEFFSTPKTYYVKEIVIPSIAVESDFKSGFSHYEPGESTFSIERNTIYRDGEIVAKFEPQIKDVMVTNSSNDVTMQMILYRDLLSSVDMGQRAVKFKDGHIVVYEYVKNKNTGTYVLITYYELYKE